MAGGQEGWRAGRAVHSEPGQSRNGREYTILGVDVWEHAESEVLRNRRNEYLAAWWATVNWDEVSARLRAAKAARIRVPVAKIRPTGLNKCSG